MNKKKILYVASFPPPVHGSAMVSKYIKESKIINEQFDGDYVNLSSSRSMEEIGKFKFVKIWRFLTSYLLLFWKLLTHRYALCYCAITCHGSGFLKDAPYVLLCKMFRNKVVIHQHNKGMAADVDRWPYRWLLPLVYRNTTVILLSWRLYEDISRVVKREQVVICPNGIPETFKEEPHFQRNNDVPHILFLSNLIVDKGVLVLLDALKILKERGYSFVCDFVGGETKEIDAARFDKEVQSRGLNAITVYRGRKYGEEKAKCFANADIFTLPSFNEALPLTILEAMENKLPVVSTDVGGISDEINDGDNGLISEINDSESLAAKLGKLISDKELRTRMGEEGYKLFKEKFTISAFEAQLLDILKDKLGGVNLSFTFVQYHGRKYGNEKDAYYRNADLFVFPTLNETFGLVNVEAMEYKLPVISSDEGGVPDVIEDGKNGIISEKGNAEKLADNISILLSDRELRERMGEEGYKLFKDKFTISAFEAQLLDILKDKRGGDTSA